MGVLLRRLLVADSLRNQAITLLGSRLCVNKEEVDSWKRDAG